MIEQDGFQIDSKVIGHYGLVSAIAKKLSIPELIDAKIIAGHKDRTVSTGNCVLALIINGFGFENRALYITNDFFKNTATENLLEPGIHPEDLSEFALGRALDEIADYGVEQLFAEIAFDIDNKFNFSGNTIHLDTTSFKVHGQYENLENDSQIMEITHGYSKDHRPDLKQFVETLAVSGKSRFPLWMNILSGNESDAESFRKTIEKMRNFMDQLQYNDDFIFIADAALYSAGFINEFPLCKWITRAQETIKDIKDLVNTSDSDIKWEKQITDYKLHEYTTEYGGLPHRWILVFSDQAYKREQKSFEKRLKKKNDTIKKKITKLENMLFASEAIAISAFNELKAEEPLFDMIYQIKEVKVYSKKGRPGPDTPHELRFSLNIGSKVDEEAVALELNKKGRFVISTNLMDKEEYPSERILAEYMSQNDVERGFRFLKDPKFEINGVFLKNNNRIAAVMMIMTLCLMVYNVGEHWIRQGLIANGGTFRNQKKKQVQNPTLRWIIQCFKGVASVEVTIDGVKKKKITNLDPDLVSIVKILGEQAMQIYGVT